MGDSREVWDMLKEAEQENKYKTFAKNLEQYSDYPYKVKICSNTHWQVELDNVLYNFWPTSNRWNKAHDPKVKGRAQNFVHFIETILDKL